MILSHGTNGLMPFDDFPAWGQVPVHAITKFSSSLFVMVFGIAQEQVRVTSPFVGGGFGHRVEPLNFEMIAGCLARAAGGVNPGAGRVRMALVAEPAECLEAADRIVRFCQAHA
mgnify:CR=1 FL=1